MINKYIRKNKKSKSTHKNKRHKHKKSIKNRIQGGFNPKNPTPKLPPRKYLEQSVVNKKNNISAMNPTIQRVLLGIQNQSNSTNVKDKANLEYVSGKKHATNQLYTRSNNMTNTNLLRYSNNPLYNSSSVYKPESVYEEVNYI